MVGGEGTFLEKFSGTGALMLHGHVISMDLHQGEDSGGDELCSRFKQK